ncbi:putative NACHT and WD domain protein [Rosellinia necatrix]|uniref:Putative NACHT and WD domain protein n=1 Tax=Rosellinia necatrix TaxID=77044 RepID=A0A1S7UMB6_ROSNE|nr:putative NACHT and WD domain protein [Rosellinia necatrix]
MAGTKPTEVPLALEKEGAKLWKDAYADLKDKDPRRLAYYEEIVSQRILLGAPGLPRSLLTSLTDIFGDMDSSPLIYKAFLAKITNLFVFGQGYDEYYAKPVDSTYQTMNTGAEKVKAAIIPWAATDSSAYVSAGNPLTNSVDTTGCSYILQRLPQYGILPELIFSASTHDSKYSRSLRKGITNLYQSILAFHVQFIFHASGHTPIVYQDEHISIPDTSSSFRAVIEAERTLMGDCTSDMKVQIHQILKDIPQPEHTPNNDGSVVAIDTLHGGSSEGPAVTWEKQDRMDGTVAEYQNFTGPRESSCPLDDQKNRSHATILSTASRNVSLGGAVPVTMAADEQMLGLFYSWVTSTKEYSSVFRQREKKNRVLCVTGTLGSGKSLLMLSIAHRISRGESKPKGLKYCSYFFCSRSFPNCNSFSSVLNGLINMLVKDQILLQKHLEAQRNLVRQGELIILDDFLVLSNILSSILRDKNFNPTVFLVDGVDKLSSEELDKLLRVIRITARISKRITWIISATLQHDCSAPLPWLGKLPRYSNLVWNASQRRLVTAFEDHYIPNKIDELVPGAYLTEDLRNSLINMIRDRACGNFLWAEIACLTARETGPRHMLDSLANIPDKGDIHELYKYLEARLLEPNTETRRLYRQILAYAAVAFKPLKIYELRGFLELSPETDLCSIVYGPLSTFLRVDSKSVSFFDSSARDFIIDRDCMGMGVSSTHAIIAHSCLRLLAEFFQAHETPQSPETVSYAASYWIKHFCEATDIQRSTKAAVEFLAEYSLEWLDLLSSTGKQLELFNLLRDLEKVSMERDLSESSELNSDLLIRVRETHRLYCFHQSMSSPAQPQVKNSLLFYPLGNDIKQKLFAKNLSDVKILPTIRNNRSSLINKLQGYSGDVSACCYSPDGKLVASGSSDDKIHIWDAYTGTIQNIIDTKMPEEWINIVSLAANGHLAATNGSVIKVWNILDSNAYEVFSTTTNYSEGVYDIQLSKNGMRLAATIFGHVKMWRTTRPAALFNGALGY